MSNSSKTAVIGLGNTLRRDDGIGIHLLALLQEKFKGADISFLNFGIASFGLIGYLKEFEKVLLIDAIDAGLEPGALKIFRLNEASGAVKDVKVSSHELSLADLMTYCEAFGFATDVHIAGIQVKDISYGLEMTGELERAKTRLAEEIKAFLSRWHT